MLVCKEMLYDLPQTVQNWLQNSGIIGKPLVQNVFLEQEIKMQLRPNQKKWFNANAKQNFTVDPPSFSWTVLLKMNPLIFVTGRDSFKDGKGAMKMKLFSVFPLVNEKDNPKINEATLQRYLAEIVWFPSAALSSYIQWEAIDSNSAKATMTYKGNSGKGIFYFDQNGGFQKFTAIRFKEVKENAKPIEWTVKAIKTAMHNDISIPVVLEANWKMENQQWTWLKLKIKAIHY